jgi:hypothetical protein
VKQPSETSQRSAIIDRLVQVRKEQETALEFRHVADEYSSKARLHNSQVQQLEMELKDLTPSVGDFLNRLSNFIGGGMRHQVTSAQMHKVFRIRDEAQALWEEPSDALSHRLAALENAPKPRAARRGGARNSAGVRRVLLQDERPITDGSGTEVN